MDKKYLDNTERDWKHTLEWLSKRKNLRVFLMSNYDIHRAALITQQSLVAKLTLKYQIDFPEISTEN